MYEDESSTTWCVVCKVGQSTRTCSAKCLSGTVHMWQSKQVQNKLVESSVRWNKGNSVSNKIVPVHTLQSTQVQNKLVESSLRWNKMK